MTEITAEEEYERLPKEKKTMLILMSKCNAFGVESLTKSMGVSRECIELVKKNELKAQRKNIKFYFEQKNLPADEIA